MSLRAGSQVKENKYLRKCKGANMYNVYETIPKEDTAWKCKTIIFFYYLFYIYSVVSIINLLYNFRRKNFTFA